MAFSITPTTPSFSDNAGGLTVSWTGATTGTAYHYVYLAFRINGVVIWTKTIYNPGASGSWNFAFTQTALWDVAKGKPISSSVSIYAENAYDNGMDIPTTYGTITRSGGTITITGVLTAGASWVTSPTTAAPWNMDGSTSRLTTAWSRPSNHSAFYGRIKVYVWNGSAWVTTPGYYLDWSMYSTNSNTLLTTYPTDFNNLITAMNSGSPRDVKLELYTQFYTGGYVTVSGVVATKIVSGGIIKSFYQGSRIGIFDGASWVNHETYVFDGATWNKQQVYVFNGSAWVESL